MFQVPVPRGVEVRVLSWAPIIHAASLADASRSPDFRAFLLSGEGTSVSWGPAFRRFRPFPGCLASGGKTAGGKTPRPRAFTRPPQPAVQGGAGFRKFFPACRETTQSVPLLRHGSRSIVRKKRRFEHAACG